MRNKLRESCAATAKEQLCICSQDDLSILKINFFENILNIRYERKISQISQKMSNIYLLLEVANLFSENFNYKQLLGEL